ncbi:TadE/TadG family type IV pilus assembly protein [Sagittula sp. SSi028]|uniref:TadE/TadG family type IV pilus assembly protein n=1 Tax=Sagittula sp. SSi028 TaxID=3400636 RepID=UPI003AF42D32
MIFKSCFNRVLKRFAKDTEGSISIEALIWFPMILAVLASMFSLFDAFRYKSLNAKAAYTISDALSRETDPIDNAYIDGMEDVLEFLTISEGPYSLRVTLVNYDGTSYNPDGSIASVGEGYQVEWSQTRGDFDDLTTADLKTFTDKLPNLLNNERVILVETRTEYVPPFVIPVLNEADLFYTYGFTRPRFAPKISWSDS